MTRIDTRIEPGLVQRVYLSDFHRAFEAKGRITQFSVDGLDALFHYIDELACDMDEVMELDVIAICCEFTEYDNIMEYGVAYGTTYDLWSEVDALVILVGSRGAIVQNT